jgi:hypothetical protein
MGGPLGRTTSDKAADWSEGSTPRPLKRAGLPGHLRAGIGQVWRLREGRAAPVTWCTLFSRHVATAGKRRPLRRGSGSFVRAMSGH